jgi:chromosome segregation ATPase
MEFLNRNILPKFQERLDLTSSDLNDEIEIFVKSINELAGRAQIIKDMIPAESRSSYSEEESYPILDKIDTLTNDLQSLISSLEDFVDTYETQVEEYNSRFDELERRFNALDDVAVRSEDFAVLVERIDKLEG